MKGEMSTRTETKTAVEGAAAAVMVVVAWDMRHVVRVARVVVKVVKAARVRV